MEYQAINKESPLGISDESELKYYMQQQQNKAMKGINLDNLIMDGGTGGGNSKRVNNYIKNKSSKRSNHDSGKIKGKTPIYSKKGSKKSTANSKINKYFGGSRKNSKYKPIDVANLIKYENNKQKGLNKQSKKYSPHPNELRRKTNSVEPPSGLRMVSSPGNNTQIKYHRHNKSVNQPNPKHKSKHYVMSQGNSELKQTLENAKRKTNALRSLHRSDLNSLDQDDSSEYDRHKEIENEAMISKEVKIPSDLYASYKRQKLIFNALDTPMSHLPKETSPNFVGNSKKGKNRPSSMVGAHAQKSNSSKDNKKRASSSNPAQHRQHMMNGSNGSSNSHEKSAQYSAQKYYDMYNQNHNKSAHTSAPKYFNSNYSNHNWELTAGYPKNVGLKVIEEISNSKKQLANSKKYIHVRSNESSQSNFQMRRSSDKKIKINAKNQKKPKEIDVERDHPTPEVMGKSKKNEYVSKLRDYEHIKKERKSKSNTKEAYSQNSNYNDHMATKNGSLLDQSKMVSSSDSHTKGKHRKVESKIEHYMDKLEENSVIENLEEIKHSDLLAYVDPVLFNTMAQTDFDELSPRSKEINSTIRIVKKSFREYSEPPETTTGFYKIGRMLGKGAFGKVNLGMHKLARKLVAIKSMNKQYLNDERSKRKVMQEVSIIKRTRHPNVVKLYETFESNKHVLFSMEMCAGGDLLNYVRKRRKLKENVAKVLFKQIIEAIGYIHTRNIVHRDIKLDNILLDGKGHVKIGDFGVSRIVKNGETMKEQCGTPAYIAPEILEDKGYTGYAVDIWSAGVVLYSMLYGSVPFKANNMEELHTMIMKGKYTLKEDISEEARDLLKIMLEKSPRKRASVQTILHHDWFKDLDKTLSIFNEQEIAQIRKEFTYNEARRIQRKDDELEAADCFTELAIDTTQNTDLKNVSSKSIILAPFNSTKSHVSDLHESITQNMFIKNLIIKFEAKCRDVDRQYEMNN